MRARMAMIRMRMRMHMRMRRKKHRKLMIDKHRMWRIDLAPSDVDRYEGVDGEYGDADADAHADADTDEEEDALQVDDD
jgi:hypothetical protein